MGRPTTNPPRPTRFGVRLRELRESARMSQRRLAELAGITHVYVSKLENGRLESDRPSRRVIAAIQTALEVTGDDLTIAAGIVPDDIKRRIMERPDVFLRLAKLSDRALDKLTRNLTNGR